MDIVRQKSSNCVSLFSLFSGGMFQLSGGGSLMPAYSHLHHQDCDQCQTCVKHHHQQHCHEQPFNCIQQHQSAENLNRITRMSKIYFHWLIDSSHLKCLHCCNTVWYVLWPEHLHHVYCWCSWCWDSSLIRDHLLDDDYLEHSLYWARAADSNDDWFSKHNNRGQQTRPQH